VDYVGDYENPGYGTVSVLQDSEGLKMKTFLADGPLSHYHYDVFELKALFGGEELNAKVAFAFDPKGNITGLSIPLEPSVKDIVFTRAADKGMMEKGFLEKLVGTYVLPQTEVKITLRDGKTLIGSVPGQPDYELVPFKGTEFNFKGMAGFSVEFKLDAAGMAVEIVIRQPNGTVSAKKK
jgi:hypothetical protein